MNIIQQLENMFRNPETIKKGAAFLVAIISLLLLRIMWRSPDDVEKELQDLLKSSEQDRNVNFIEKLCGIIVKYHNKDLNNTEPKKINQQLLQNLIFKLDNEITSFTVPIQQSNSDMKKLLSMTIKLSVDKDALKEASLEEKNLLLEIICQMPQPNFEMIKLLIDNKAQLATPQRVMKEESAFDGGQQVDKISHNALAHLSMNRSITEEQYNAIMLYALQKEQSILFETKEGNESLFKAATNLQNNEEIKDKYEFEITDPVVKGKNLSISITPIQK